MATDRDGIEDLARAVVARFSESGLTIATAESCTGGLVAAALTDVPGSSAVLDLGFVTYSNRAKGEMLGVPSALLAEHGAVSEAVARAMAEGARAAAGCDVAVSVTGVAGPGGGSAEKPVGLVHFAVAAANVTRATVERFGERPRQEIRRGSVATALRLLLSMADEAG